MATRPVLLSVDDDPAVSRALARDLRRRYGENYRVVRAENGPAALEALRELTVRGEATAVLLADQRMSGMSGVEFLEQAMDLVPKAKRVLLTAYADTQAAIRAINEVDLDHYLLKPWDPPEEHLYPVLDELLDGRGVLRLRTRREGDFAIVEVTDEGPGIPAEIQARVFEPFVTTKPAGKGSGLGLENAKRIVERRHGGTISFTTGPDGTTFSVRLPLVPTSQGVST